MPTQAQSAFAWTVRVYYEDTDAAGIVYHANYLRFCERARTEWLRGHGFGQESLRREWQVGFVLASTAVNFLYPARLDDELEVTVNPTRILRASLEFDQEVLIHGADRTAVRLTARVACVDPLTSRPRPIPEQIMRELKA